MSEEAFNMITSIPKGQICQSFDPKMHVQKEVLEYHNATINGSMSCVAPAYVYIEGIHGKKFLCDYHYHYEIYMTKSGYSNENNSWENVHQYMVDERERVKETFAKNVTTTETLGQKCSLLNSFNKTFGCTADAFVKVTPIQIVPNKINWTVIDRNNISQSLFYCSFHFRREYYRYSSNGTVYEDFHQIVDERSRMTMTIAEQAAKLTYV